MKHAVPNPGWKERTIQLLGEEKMAQLDNVHVLVVGM